jgi:hypothetical protein
MTEISQTRGSKTTGDCLVTSQLPIWLQILISVSSASVGAIALGFAIYNNRRAEKFTKISLRPFVAMTDSYIEFYEDSKLIRVVVELKNNGKLPTKNLKQNIAFKIMEAGEETPGFFHDSFHPGIDLSQDTEIDFEPDRFGPAKSVSIEDIICKKQSILVIGEVKYEDYFGDHHSLKVRMRTPEKSILLKTPENNQNVKVIPLAHMTNQV